MTLTDIISRVRFLTNSDSNSYTDADITANVNIHYHNLVNEIIEVMDDWDFQENTATQDLVADQQDYDFPTGILTIKKVEVTYDGTNWYPATLMDINERKTSANDSSSISDDFDKTKPYYDLAGDKIRLFPIPDNNVTGGLKVWYHKEVTELSGTASPVIAKAYHDALCYGAASDFCYRHDQFNKAELFEAKMEKAIQRMKDFYAHRVKDKIIQMKMSNESYK